jgi:hypothetical protein
MVVPCRPNYYLCSLLCLLCVASLGCAGPNQVAANASRVTLVELNGTERAAAFQKLSSLPVVLEFKQGDRVPVSFMFDSELASLEAPDFTLIAKRTFYVLLRNDGPPLLSRDGIDFEERRKNSFFVGFDVRRPKQTRMRIGLGIWPEGTLKP